MTAGDIYTVAGSASGLSGTTGNGGPATSAQLNRPSASASTRPATCSSPTPARCPARSWTSDSAIPPTPGDQFAGPAALRHHGQPARRRPGHLLPPVRRLLRRRRTSGGRLLRAAGRSRAPALTYSTTTQTYTFIPSPGSDTLHLFLGTASSCQRGRPRRRHPDDHLSVARARLGELPGDGHLLRDDHLRSRAGRWSSAPTAAAWSRRSPTRMGRPGPTGTPGKPDLGRPTR